MNWKERNRRVPALASVDAHFNDEKTESPLLCPRFREDPVDIEHKRTGLLCNKTIVSSLLVQSLGKKKTQI